MLKKLIFILAAVYLVAVLSLRYAQDHLLYHPSPTRTDQCTEISRLGGTIVGLSHNGHPQKFLIREVPKPRGWFIHFHGNSGSACDRTYFIEALKDLNWNIVLAEYPGYFSGSEKPTQERILESASVVYDHVIRRNDSNLPIVLYGESLGTGVATYLATQRKVGGLILQGPYTSVLEIGESRYPWAPVELLLRDPYPANLWAPQVNTKVLALHGKQDSTIPIEFGRRQIANFKTSVKWLEFEGVGHGDFRTVAAEKYWNAIKQFLNEVGQHPRLAPAAGSPLERHPKSPHPKKRPPAPGNVAH